MTVDEWNKGCRPNSLPKQKLNFNALPTLESEYTVQHIVLLVCHLIKGTSVTFPWRCFVCWDRGQVFLAEPLEHCPFLEMLDLCYYFIIINNYKSTEMSVCGSIGKRVKLAHCVIRWMETSSTPLDKLYKVHDARFAKCAQL